MLQVLIDHLVFERPLDEAIGDTRVHWYDPFDATKRDAIEAEASLGAEAVGQLKDHGWDVALREPPGTGRHFGGINAITINNDGTFTGFADPRRTNQAVGIGENLTLRPTPSREGFAVEPRSSNRERRLREAPPDLVEMR